MSSIYIVLNLHVVHFISVVSRRPYTSLGVEIDKDPVLSSEGRDYLSKPAESAPYSLVSIMLKGLLRKHGIVFVYIRKISFPI